jgi:hypothetical protein
MVRAILEGRKTQTRRVMKPKPVGVPKYRGGLNLIDNNFDSGLWEVDGRIFKSPYGRSGDRLWVRETWMPVDLSFRDSSKYTLKEDDEGKKHAVVYKADEAYYCDWQPSIFMPRWASRVNLEILDVRAEKLHDITTEDVRAEGIKQTEPDGFWLAPLAGTPDFPWNDARMAYAALWNSINEKSGFGWDKNPWVWVIEFKRLG